MSRPTFAARGAQSTVDGMKRLLRIHGGLDNVYRMFKAMNERAGGVDPVRSMLVRSLLELEAAQRHIDQLEARIRHLEAELDDPLL